MNTVFKLLMFTLALNFASGLMATLLPDIGLNPLYNPNLQNPDMDNSGFIAATNSSISPTPDQSNTFFRLIDSLNIGIIAKFLSSIYLYLYGFLNFLQLIFHLDNAIVGMFTGILTVCYIIGAIWLWTGKNVTQ